MDIYNENTTVEVNVAKRNFFERHSTVIKMFVIGFITLLLLIPLDMIESLITERKVTRKKAVEDITSKWGSEQTVVGPCLVLPYSETIVDGDKRVETENYLLVLPEYLNIQGSTAVEQRRRGIYNVSLYGVDAVLSGEFDMSVISKYNVPTSRLKPDKMQVILGLSDLKGIKDKVILNVSGRQTEFEPGLQIESLATGVFDIFMTDNSYSDEAELFSAGLNAKLDSVDNTVQKLSGKLPFSISLKMNGSYSLYFTPIGKTTTVGLKSDWATPSFDGSFLPESRSVTDSGFVASWKVLNLNRSYGQVLNAYESESINKMAQSRFGVKFIQAVDQYQQNMRSVKYAILIVLLTFVAVFFIELIKKKSVNTLQYLLVGLALVIFYSLLLSLSEVCGFAWAYLISAVMTMAMISIQMSSILKDVRQGLFVGALLAFLYLFVYILIQMESYALLVGSLGLFAILAVIMYYSRKIKLL